MPQQKEQRKNNRVKLLKGFEDIKVDLSTEHHFLDGMLVNISLNGSAIRFPDNLLNLKPELIIDDRVTLKFHVPYPENEDQLVEEATIKYVSKHILGAQFNNFCVRKYQLILNNVKDLMKKNKH